MKGAHAVAILFACFAGAQATKGQTEGRASLELGAVAAARSKELEAEWSAVLDPPAAKPKQSPIQRVVALLEKMKAELLGDGKKEAKMYDKMVCWCETNEKEKVKAIADADAKDKDLTAEIEERAAAHGKLATDIQYTKDLIAEAEEALKKARAVREGEAGEFRDGEKDMVQAINNLRNAIAVLSRHHTSSDLLQLQGPMLASCRAVLRDVAIKYEYVLGDHAGHDAESKHLLAQRLEGALIAVDSKTVRTGGQQAQLEARAQEVRRALLGALNTKGAEVSEDLPIHFAEERLAEEAGRLRSVALPQLAPGAPGSYAPQSGVIFGILQQMKEDFETKLKAEQGEESTSAADYAALKEAKDAEIAAMKEKLDTLEAEFFANQKALGDAKEDLELTREQRSKDVEFLRNLRLTCQDLDKQWEIRSKMRAEELKAVTETIAIITEDDARDQLSKSAVTLLQVDSVSVSESGTTAALRRNAAAVLRRVAQSPDFDADDLLDAWKGRSASGALAKHSVLSPRAALSTLAVSVELDAFTKVIEACDKMIEELKAEQVEEVKLKEFCTTEFDENEKMTYEKTEEKTDLEAQIKELTMLIEKLSKEIEECQEQISDTQVEMKKASENREAENAEYQTVVADERATQAILAKALTRLQAFYKFIQKGAQTPPVQFNKYKKNAGASPVMGLLEQIIEDSKKTEADAISAESAAQADYETMIKDSNGLIDKLTEAITEKTKAIEGAKLKTATAKGELADTVAELESLAAYKEDLHGQCDFVLKNFKIRQAARLSEIEAIQEAKAILKGMGGKGGIDK